MQKQLYETRTIRIFNKCTTHDFMTKLSYETWGNIFDGNDVDIQQLPQYFFKNFLFKLFQKESTGS